jgi:hypothetical protein
MSAIMNLEDTATIELYIEETPESEGASNLVEPVAKLVGSYKARCSYTNYVRKLPQNGNLTEITINVKAVVSIVLDRTLLKAVKDTGHFLLKGQKYSLVDYKISDVMAMTVLTGSELGDE